MQRMPVTFVRHIIKYRRRQITNANEQRTNILIALVTARKDIGIFSLCHYFGKRRSVQHYVTKGDLRATFRSLLNFRVALYSGRDKGETRSSEKEVAYAEANNESGC
jgi:hypothetical protein